MHRSLADAVATTLADAPEGLTVRDLLRALRAAGLERASRSAVERTLAEDGRFSPTGPVRDPKVRWVVEDGGAPVRRAIRDAPPGRRAPAVDAARPLDGLDLRDWQVEAFAGWAAAGCRGVVEAVTGTGKTRLAVAAVRAALAQGGRALVLVPTLDLLDQWRRELATQVPGARLGQLGGGAADDLHDHDVVVATPHSAAAVPVDLPAGAVGLLVADEAHRYGAPTWGAALRETFAMRLALTATYERNDDGLTEVLGPYFGGVVCQYGYDRAVPDGVVAPFRIALVGTALEDAERAAYDTLDADARRWRRDLLARGYPQHWQRLFARVSETVARAGGGHGDDAEVRACRAYLAAVRGRRDVAANAAGKLAVCDTVGPVLARTGARTLVFTDTVDQAELAARALSAHGVAAEEVHGDLPGEKRRIRLAQFRNGNLQVVVAPRVLDEGVDVPEADLALVLAAFRTRRQMVQRLGRVLRLKADGRDARLVLVHATDTAEDPANGGHRDFLADVRPVAREVVRIDADDEPDALPRWLST
ncbi:MAG: DEAD/DEAH box helicase [Actinomycetes bacterium]